MALLSSSFYGDIDISSQDFLDWQYLQNPGGEVIGYVAEDSERIVGQYLVIPINLCYKGTPMKGSLSLNTLTHPEYSGQGIFTSLARLTYSKCAQKGVVMTYGFPNPNSYHGFVKKLGFTDIGSVPLLISPINIETLLRFKLGSKSAARLMGYIISPVRRLLQPRADTYGKGMVVKEVCEFGDGYGRFWQSVKDNYTLMVNRTPEYMNWRYFSIPRRNYKVFIVLDGDKVISYIAIRITEFGGVSTGLIVDFITHRSQQGKLAGCRLVKTAMNYFRSQKADMAGCLMLGHTLEFSVLKEMGFWVCPRRLMPQDFPVIVKVHVDVENNKKEAFYSLCGWFITMGDYDVG